MNAEDAAALRAAEGDWVRITSRRGSIEVPVRLGGIERGRVFVPFHYGYWDDPECARAANELTIFEWDEVSKQPHYKYAAVSITCIDAPSTTQPDEEVSKAPGLLGRAKQAAESPSGEIMRFEKLLRSVAS